MATDSVLFLGWNRPVTGREKMAVELFNQFMGYLGKQQQGGKIAGFEPVLLNVHGGDLNGFIVVRGERAKLDDLRASDEFLDLVTRAAIHVDRFGVIPGWTGEGVMKQMGRYQKAL